MTKRDDSRDRLSADIHLLGDTLGRVIRQQAGIAVFDLEERIRALSKTRRTDPDPAVDHYLAQLVETLSLEDSESVARAFTTYFELINIAEENHRVRVLRQREREAAPYGRYPTLNSTEQYWSVTAPMFPRIRATLTETQLRAGVTARTPFLDDRLYRFAMSRAREERVTARETKRLLRHAMRGILPDAFLAPRPRRTGVTTQYMREAMRGPARALFDDVFRRPLLAEMGIVDGPRAMLKAGPSDEERTVRVFLVPSAAAGFSTLRRKLPAVGARRGPLL